MIEINCPLASPAQFFLCLFKGLAVTLHDHLELRLVFLPLREPGTEELSLRLFEGLFSSPALSLPMIGLVELRPGAHASDLIMDFTERSICFVEEDDQRIAKGFQRFDRSDVGFAQ